MNVYISIDGDNVGQLVGRLSLADDIEGLRRISRKIEQGNELWASWALAAGGSVVSDGGDEARIEVPAEKLPEIPEIRRQYEGLTGHSCSVGVGMRISDADRALLIAKLRGKDRAVLWDQAFQQELEDAQKSDEPEAKKLSQHCLGKAQDGGYQDDDNAGGTNQQVGHGRENMSERFRKLAQTPKAAPQEGTDPADIPADADDAGAQQGAEDPKVHEALAAALLKIKRAAPILEKMKAQNPELYQAVKGAIDAMLMMASKASTSVEKSEKSPAPEKLKGGIADALSMELKQGVIVEMEHTDDEQKAREIALDHLAEDPRYYTKLKEFEGGLAKACKCDAYRFPHREGGGGCKTKKAKSEAVEKDERQVFHGQKGRVQIDAPVGTTKQGAAPGNGSRETGKVKVQRDPALGGDGKTKWVSVRAGQKMGVNGGPVSSLETEG